MAFADTQQLFISGERIVAHGPFFYFSGKNKAWDFMWIVCRLLVWNVVVFSLKKKMSSATILLSASRAKTLVCASFFFFFFFFFFFLEQSVWALYIGIQCNVPTIEFLFGMDTEWPSRSRWLRWMRVRLVIRRLRVRPPLGRQHSFVEIDHEIFSTGIFSLPLLQDGERMCIILVNHLED